jgi:mannose-6-phosphate isomerase-like protein (cupin superfamily)
MNKTVLGLSVGLSMGLAAGLVAVFAFSHGVVFAQGGPKEATDITNAEVLAVLKAGAAKTPPAVDQTLRVLDMGTYAMSVAVIHRGATPQPGAGRGAGAGGGAGRAGGAGGGAGRGAASANAATSCGLTEAPAGAQMSPPGMIAHDQTTETYIVISGSGTLVTGGQIVNGRRSGPESDVTKILNGPSCSGTAAGNIVSRVVNVGDITVIPAGVPHGWTAIADHVDYLSVRPDPDKVLQHGYVNPALTK